MNVCSSFLPSRVSVSKGMGTVSIEYSVRSFWSFKHNNTGILSIVDHAS